MERGGNQLLNHALGGWNQSAAWNNLHTHSQSSHHTQAPQQREGENIHSIRARPQRHRKGSDLGVITQVEILELWEKMQSCPEAQ